MLFCQFPFDRRQGDPPLHSREYQKLFIERLKRADIPAQMQNQDWNSQYIQHVDAKAKADTIRQTVRAALDEPLVATPAMQSRSNASVDANDESGVQHDRGHFEFHMHHGQL